ncbi:MAG: hypothetical protein V3S41_06205 [Spirochaetia bacterium]
MNYRPKRLTFAIACVLAVTYAFIAGCANPELPTDPTEVLDPPASSDPEPDPVPDPPAEPDPPIIAYSTVLIDFDSAVPGIIGEAFAASGFGVSPGPGQLDADAWSILGFSDGDLVFGQEASSGDWARGVSVGGVSTGGLYAFIVEPDNHALGVQPTATDFAPGSIILKTAVPADSITQLQLDHRIWTLNDKDRSTVWSTWYSLDGTTWIELTGMAHTTPILADADAQWSGAYYTAVVSLKDSTLSAGDPFYLRWDVIDGEGTGSRDESAIDDISVTFAYEE